MPQVHIAALQKMLEQSPVVIPSVPWEEWPWHSGGGRGSAHGQLPTSVCAAVRVFLSVRCSVLSRVC